MVTTLYFLPLHLLVAVTVAVVVMAVRVALAVAVAEILKALKERVALGLLDKEIMVVQHLFLMPMVTVTVLVAEAVLAL
jgi:hypothetical protein